MKGTSNITSSGVFIEKRYRYEDIFIGWKFAGLIYLRDSSRREGEKKVMVDLNLIHDVLPQSSGGEELLGYSDVTGPPHRHRRVRSNVFETRGNQPKEVQ